MGKELYMIDENGEIQGKFDTEKQYIRTKTQDKFAKKKQEQREEFKKFNKQEGKFIWSYPEKIQHLIKSNEFTKADLTMVFYLATFVNGVGYLVRDNNITKLKKVDLQERLDISRNAFSTFYNKLVKHDILLPEGTHFKWNDTYNFYGSTKGKAKPSELVRTYVNQIRTLYRTKKANGKRKYSPTKLYPVFALVPYLHYSSNIICKNPTVKDVEDIEYYSLSEITDLLDLKDSKKMSTSLSSILLNDQSVFRRIEIKNEKYLQMNPRIFWKDSSAPNERLIAEFDMVDKNREMKKKA